MPLKQYYADRSKVHAKMGNTDLAAEDILEAKKIPAGDILYDSYVDDAARELLKLKDVQGALQKLKSESKIDDELAEVLDQLTSTTKFLVVKSAAHDEKLDQHDDKIEWLYNTVTYLLSRDSILEDEHNKIKEEFKSMNDSLYIAEQDIVQLKQYLIVANNEQKTFISSEAEMLNSDIRRKKQPTFVELVTLVEQNKLTELREIDKSTLQQRNIDGKTLLHVAASHNSVLDIIKFLLHEIKLSLTAFDDAELYPVHYAALEGSTEVLDFFLRQDVQLVHLQCEDSFTPLHLAAQYLNIETMILLIEKYGATLNVYNLNGYTPIRICIEEYREYLKYTEVQDKETIFGILDQLQTNDRKSDVLHSLNLLLKYQNKDKVELEYLSARLRDDFESKTDFNEIDSKETDFIDELLQKMDVQIAGDDGE